MTKLQDLVCINYSVELIHVPFGVTYEKIGTIQRRLAWPLHKDDTLFRSGRPTGLNIYFTLNLHYCILRQVTHAGNCRTGR